MIKQNKEELMKGICLTLDNYENVSNVLEDIPHREFLDLYVTYNIFTGNGGELRLRKLSKEDVKELCENDEELYQRALENTMRMFPPKIDSLDNVLNGLIGCFPEYGITPGGFTETPYLYLGNVSGMYGSAVILYDELLGKIAELVCEDFYLMPSSIHEYLLVTDTAIHDDIDWLIFMVRDVNRTCLDKEMVLSNNVYHYCHESNNISVIIR